jgi:dTDP-4-dehydrorhamnose reductase
VKRILILGATGLLGHRLYFDLGKEFQVYGSVRSLSPQMVKVFSDHPGKLHAGIDVLAPNALEKLIADVNPDVVINAVGLIKQHKSLATDMIELNGWLPWKIQQILADQGGRLIHFSTDCVFKGDKGQYTEPDFPDATDIYGRSKALGEIWDQDNALVLRTSIIGRELQNHLSLVDWFVGQAPGSVVQGFQGAIYSGLPTHTVSKFLVNLIKLAPETQWALSPILRSNR